MLSKESKELEESGKKSVFDTSNGASDGKFFYKRTMATARWEKLVGKNSLGRAEARKRGVVLEALQGRSKQELVGSRAGLRREKQDPA
jgi:hypothetical protein